MFFQNRDRFDFGNESSSKVEVKETSLDELEEESLEEMPDFLVSDDKNVEEISKATPDFVVDYYANEAAQADFIPEVPEVITASNIDVFSDRETIDRILENFKQDNWNDLTNEERKECISDLKEYIQDTIGLKNPPRLEFYYNEDPGDYAYVTGDNSKIAINEYNLWNSEEAADSISHELWHAYQHERAEILENEVDYMYKDGFENYISSSVDFQLYQDQFVESDAREFAQRFKDHIAELENSDPLEESLYDFDAEV